jgi:Transposase domain (DUF772)
LLGQFRIAQFSHSAMPRSRHCQVLRQTRLSIPPERLLRALLLQALFTIRSERQLMEQLDDNLLFRWFVALGIDDPEWVPIVFTKNRDRLLDAKSRSAPTKATTRLTASPTCGPCT